MIRRCHLLLVHSPLLGPGSWEPVARDLADHGRRTGRAGSAARSAWAAPVLSRSFDVATARQPGHVDARMVSELPRVPWSLVTEKMPPQEPAAVERNYLQLSEAYQVVADRARDEGYRVVRRAVDHLALVTRPMLVGELLRAAAG